MGNSNEFIFIKSPQVNKNEIIPYLSPNFKVLLGPVNLLSTCMQAKLQKLQRTMSYLSEINAAKMWIVFGCVSNAFTNELIWNEKYSHFLGLFQVLVWTCKVLLDNFPEQFQSHAVEVNFKAKADYHSILQMAFGLVSGSRVREQNKTYISTGNN